MENEWIYIVVLAVLLVVLVVVWRQAFKSMKKTGARRRELMTKLDRLKALSEKYENITAENISEIPDADLIDVVMIKIWKKLGDEAHEMENFKALSFDEKNVYTAWYVREETTNDSLAAFFRNCGHALSGLAQNVFAVIGIPSLGPVMKRACDMFDENSDTSCDKQSLEAVQKDFESAYDAEEFCRATANYIREHSENFVG